MNYDFKTRQIRRGKGSYKWEQMLEFNPYVKDNVVPFSVADMEFVTAPEIIEGLKHYINFENLGYYTPTQEFYNSVISWMKRRHNFNVDKEWIINTSGVVPALFTSVRAFTKPGDGVVIMSPVYYPFYNCANFNDRNLVDCPLINKDDYYTIDFDRLYEITKKKENKLLIFCNPHNPIGRVWNINELKRLEEIVLENNLIIISDEIHNDLIMPGFKHIVLQTLSDDLAERVITCTAPSKTFNLAGMGLSNIIIKNERLRDLFKKELEKVSGFSYNVLGFKACEIAYNESEQWLEELLKVIDINQKFVRNFLKKNFNHITARSIEGTYLQWINFKKLGLNNNNLKKFMHNEAELFFDEGYIFGDNGSGYERMNLAAPTYVIEEAMLRLLKSLNNRSNK